MPAARGQHLFTRTKRFLMDWAREQGLAGMYSEATAAHPYSQRANIELGAHETGFLLGWIPASVANDAAAGRTAAAPVGGALLHEAERRPRAARLRARAPPRDRRPDAGAVRAAGDARRAAARRRAGAAAPSSHVEVDARPQPRPDHRPRAGRRPGDGDRGRAPPPLPPPRASTRSTSTCRWSSPATALVADDLERLGVSYAGVFPNSRTDGDVLRMQSLHRVRVKADDIAVASDHGRELLEYVLADLPQSA